MSEHLTSMQTEDAVAGANAFLESERGAALDGSFASAQIAERVLSTAERAQALLESTPHPKHTGLYVPLGRHNTASYDEAVAVLPGHMVLVPSVMVERGRSVFYPAVVSEDGLATRSLRLHVLQQPYRQELSHGATTLLSAAGQAETAGVGDHGRTVQDGVEAEHFATLLAAGSDSAVANAWGRGEHVNHVWRERQQSSVTTEVSRRLFSDNAPQTTLTVTKSDVEAGRAMLFWHEGMRGDDGRPETAARPDALVVVQGLGYQALREQRPDGLDTVKRLLA